MADLNEQYRRLHRQGFFPGYSMLPFAKAIGELVERHDVYTLLDYGCGKGHQYLVMRAHKRWRVLPHCYDPAVPGLDVMPPGMFGGVICTDVLEHVPEEEVVLVLARIFSRAKRFVFLTVCTREAKKKLPDGRNAHLTIRPEDWWRERVCEANTRDIAVQLEFTE